MKKIIFNSSNPRSGSELLQTILSQNPTIYSSATSPVLEYQFGARGNFSLPEVQSQNQTLMKKAFINVCKGIAQNYYEAITEKSVVVDKSRGWHYYLEWVEEWNPNPKILCVVRDLRDIVASMERIYQNNKFSPEGVDIPLELKNITLEQRVQYWLTTPPVGLAMLRLYDLFQRNQNNKVHFIRYEDLCNYPKDIMNRLYKYIEEPLFEHDFNNIIKTVEEDDTHYGIFGKHSVQKELKKTVENKWKDVLNEEIAQQIKNANQWYFDRFKYF